MTEQEELAAISALVAAGDERAAVARLRARFGWPHGKQVENLAAWLALVADFATRSRSTNVAEVAAEAVRDPDSPDRLYDLGYSLIDAGAPSLAASVLWHCLALVGDSEEVVCELVSALESALAYGDAFAILEQHAALRGRSFLCEYLYSFNAAMTGRLETTRAVLARLAPDTPETESMRDTIAGIVERADRAATVTSLDARDLRGWQYVLTGSLLVHQSPFGFDEPMHGRYAALQDTYTRIVTGLTSLAPLVRATQAPCIYAPPGRDHEILGRVASARLDLPLVPWPAVGVPAPGVVVAYDLASVPAAELAKLVQRRPDQIVFAHASPWTQDLPIAPDVTTLLYQMLAPPWDAEQEIDLVVREVLASPGLDAGERACDDPARWDSLVAAVWPPSPGIRARMWAGGPVASNRFD
jgi:hypothetical protein